MSICLPNWLPKRFHHITVNKHHPRYDRLKALLTKQDMKSVWQTLESEMKAPDDLPDHPLDAYLLAAQADRIRTLNMGSNLQKSRNKMKDLVQSIKIMREKMDSLLYDFQEGATFFDVMRAAGSLGINTKRIEADIYAEKTTIGPEHPNFHPVGNTFSYWLEKAPDIESFFSEFENKLYKKEQSIFKSGRNSKQEHNESKEGEDGRKARILAESLIRCTDKYFTRPCNKEISLTIWVATGLDYECNTIKQRKYKMKKDGLLD
ncbi:MAG: hypothetical protein K9K64_09200 [Desulfohalobiaceae bacterium]|nr:hypothetical protein [Desulfohalobiaceae bacterium]